MLKIQRLNLTIPYGIKDKGKATKKGMGHDVKYGKPGNLYIEIHQEPHPVFERKGDDIYTEITIDMIKAIRGTVVPVKTLLGNTKIRIRPGTRNGKNYRLKGRGIKNRKTAKIGNMYVKILTRVAR